MAQEIPITLFAAQLASYFALLAGRGFLAWKDVAVVHIAKMAVEFCFEKLKIDFD